MTSSSNNFFNCISVLTLLSMYSIFPFYAKQYFPYCSLHISALKGERATVIACGRSHTLVATGLYALFFDDIIFIFICMASFLRFKKG